MRKLATIQKVSNVQFIPGADKIELSKFDGIGWQCVAKKGEFTVGSLAVYIEIDSLLPKDNPAFAFMEKVKYRVKTIKLRGTLSQGLALPLGLFPQVKSNRAGTDVTEALGIVKYETESESETMEEINGNKFMKVLRKWVMRYPQYKYNVFPDSGSAQCYYISVYGAPDNWRERKPVVEYLEELLDSQYGDGGAISFIIIVERLAHTRLYHPDMLPDEEVEVNKEVAE